jgi:DNA-binding MarR family transcriptional regulator
VHTTVATPQQVAELLGVLSAYVNRTASPDMLRVVAELGLSFTQLKALYLLAEHGELSVTNVAERLAMSPAAMSRSVDGLVQRGHVARSESASDLPAGREVLERVGAAREAALVEFASELSDAERSELHAALLPIAERISSP